MLAPLFFLLAIQQPVQPMAKIIVGCVPRVEGARSLSFPEKFARVLNRKVGVESMVAYSAWEATQFSKAGLLVIAEDESFEDAGIIIRKDTIIYNLNRMPLSAIVYFHLPPVISNEQVKQ